MRRSQIIPLLLLILLCGCATEKSMQDENGDSESAASTENPSQDQNQDQAQNPPEQSKASGDQATENKKNKSEGETQSPDEQNANPSKDEAKAATPPPAPESAESSGVQAAPTGRPARVTALDFNANLNGGTVILKTDKPVTYTTRKNDATNQFVIELQNTVVPKRFRQPYTTKEFPGAVASINAYQAKGAEKITRVVIQLRQAVEPDVQQNGRTITVAGSGGGAVAKESSQDQPTVGNEANTEAPSETDGTAETQGENKADGSEADAIQTSDKVADDFLSGNSKFYGRPISLEVKDADIRDVLRLISEESGVNLLVQDDVQGKVTIKLRRVPWDQALLVVLKSKQLGYVKEGNILRITQLRTIEAESASDKRVIESRRDLLPLHVKIFPISYAAAVDIESQVHDFLTSRGKVHSDKRTNSLVVTDIDEVLEKVKKIVARLDTQTPQVLIEAKIIEAGESYSKLVGVNWSFQGAQTNLSTNSTGGTSTYTPRATVQPVTSGQSAIGDFGIGFANLDFFGNLDASLKLLESESLVKIISAPRIVTLDRQKAQIDQTTQFPIFNSTISPSGAAQPSVTFQDVKLQLQVTPQISSEGGVTLELDVLRQFAEAPVFGALGASARPVDSRHAQTRVLVPNGETVVIGGIYQSDVTEGESGVPWLRSLPIIGALFRQRNVDRQKNELVIFLTPRILNREKAFSSPEGGT